MSTIKALAITIVSFAALFIVLALLVSLGVKLKGMPPWVLNALVAAIPGLFFTLRGKWIVGISVGIIYAITRTLQETIGADYFRLFNLVLSPLSLAVGYGVGVWLSRWHGRAQRK